MTIVPLNTVQSIIFKNDVSYVAVLLCTTSYNKAIKWGTYLIVGFRIHLSNEAYLVLATNNIKFPTNGTQTCLQIWRL
jgi:hypothetical protein